MEYSLCMRWYWYTQRFTAMSLAYTGKKLPNRNNLFESTNCYRVFPFMSCRCTNTHRARCTSGRRHATAVEGSSLPPPF